MTNREWMMSLTDEELSKFLTDGLWTHNKIFDATGNMYIIDSFTCMAHIYRRYIHSQKGLEQWLGAPQELELVAK